MVTSADRSLAERWLDHAGLPAPAVMVGAGDVAVGKPDPGPFLRAAERLGIHPSDMVVFEDAIPGLVAARAAGARVVAVAGTLSGRELDEWDWVPNFICLSVEAGPTGLRICRGAGHRRKP